MLTLGRWELAAVEDCRFALDGGGLFGVVPKPVWEKQAPADARNRVKLAVRCLLAVDRDAKRRVLVDAGVGEKLDAKRADLYAVDRSACGGLDAGLARHGVRREDITDVILTHLHFDHAGGATRRGPTGALELAFPRATYHLQRRNWLWAHSPTEKDRASFVGDEEFELLAHSSQLHLIEGEIDLFPDFDLIVSEGHTVGQQLPRFRGDGTHLLFAGDLVPTRAHLRASWVMAFDLHPLTTIEEKKIMLAEALEDGGVVFFEHDPDVAACRLGEQDGHPVFREAVEL
jgi:glyoxylase-like metal-dependent hydrolase (beta-lactamase superfamily II)